MPLSSEKDLEILCTECGHKHDQNWDSHWDEHSSFMHYKCTACKNCGYEIHVKTEYDTSSIKHL